MSLSSMTSGFSSNETFFSGFDLVVDPWRDSVGELSISDASLFKGLPGLSLRMECRGEGVEDEGFESLLLSQLLKEGSSEGDFLRIWLD